jgi:excisionase family DNA binding protein
MANEQWLTVEEIVALLKVHEQTVRRWLREGQLRGVLLGRKAGYRVRARDLEDFLAARETGEQGKAVA